MLTISIDLWGTLIKSSPGFAKAKVAFTQKYFDADESHIQACFASVKKQFNAIIEVSGLQPSEKVIFNMLFSKLNGRYADVAFYDEFTQGYQMLALQENPLLYSSETAVYLDEIAGLGELFLSSNTMFIKGETLKKIMFGLGIGQVFKRFYFSDELGESKPSKIMYGNSDYHIGDNEMTDGVGAENALSKPIIINSNAKTIKDAYHIIAQYHLPS